MPVVSEAQRRAMYAAKEGHSTLGIPKKVGEEFIDASHGVKHLPARKTKHEPVKAENARRMAHALTHHG